MNIAVLGAQWGDEGKGKIVDLLTPHFGVVARYQGGHNAGHTVYVDGQEVRAAPHPVGHPARRRHLRHRQRRGRRSAGAVRRDRRARRPRDRRRRPPAHQREGAPHPAVPPRARRAERGAARRAQDRHDVARHRAGLRGQDRPPRHPRAATWSTPRRWPTRCARTSTRATRSSRTRRSSGAPSTTSCSSTASGCGSWTGDVSLALDRRDARTASACSSRARRARCSTSITAPIPTSPRRTRRSAARAPASAFRRSAIDGVLGVAKAYTTRVGEGPLPTELHGEMGERLRESGQEYGASTGRPRRCGWYDAVVVRYAVRINGIDALALTKLDVLDGLDRIEICTGYRCRRATSHRVSGRSRYRRRRHAGLRVVAGMDDADPGRHAVRGSAGRGAALHRQARGSERRAGGDRVHGVGSRRNHRPRRQHRGAAGSPKRQCDSSEAGARCRRRSSARPRLRCR